MKKLNFVLIILLLCGMSWAQIDTRLVMVENYTDPSDLIATLTIGVEIKGDGQSHEVIGFQNAIAIDENLTKNLVEHHFMDQMFPPTDLSGNGYTASEKVITRLDSTMSAIQFIYTFEKGSPTIIPATTEWYRALTIQLRYEPLQDAFSSIEWFEDPYPPLYMVLDQDINQLEGVEQEVPVELRNFTMEPYVLPVELASFEAESADGQIMVHWSTASETNNAGFYVLRSASENGPFETVTPNMISGAGNSDSENVYEFTDEEVEANKEYFYKLMDVDFNGRQNDNGLVSILAQPPRNYELANNYPNPFNPETTIKFKVKDTGKVVLAIFNSQGQEVRRLVDENLDAGIHDIVWDGRNDLGIQVSSGTYFYRMSVNDFNAIKKMQLLK